MLVIFLTQRDKGVAEGAEFFVFTITLPQCTLCLLCLSAVNVVIANQIYIKLFRPGIIARKGLPLMAGITGYNHRCAAQNRVLYLKVFFVDA